MSAVGPEAAAFLHGQITQDVQSLDEHAARLGGYCSAKGRLLASGWLLRPAEDTIWWWVDASVHAATLKRLSMFVLRSKLKLSALTDCAAVGLIGLGAAKAAVPQAEQLVAPWQATCLAAATPEQPATMLMRLPDVQGAARWVWLGPQALAAEVISRAGALPDDVQPAWAWLEVMSGVPRIEAPTADQFVPQMINLELVGGVNFKKGCYPGQEIVARSQYRGTVKRRAHLVNAAQALAPGQEVFSAQDAAQPCGMVVNAAPAPHGGWTALVELKLAHAQEALSAGQGDGAVFLTPVALPYELPGEEA
jgi:tRNA-modifying protein YgfZ